MSKRPLRVARRQSRDYIDQAEKTKHDLETQVGNTERKRHIEITSVLFLQTLIDECEGTFVWEGPRMGDKHRNVFEALAAQMPAFQGKGLQERAQFVEETGPKLRQGFNGARKWLAMWHTATVYCVPQNHESSIQTVLTLDPDYRVECGRTAAEMQTERDFKLAAGQVRASAMRLVASSDDKKANALIRQIMDQVSIDLKAELAKHHQLQLSRQTAEMVDE